MATQRLRLQPMTEGPWTPPENPTPRSRPLPGNSIAFDPNAPTRVPPTGDGLSLEPKGAKPQQPMRFSTATPPQAPNWTTSPGAAPTEPRGRFAGLRERIDSRFGSGRQSPLTQGGLNGRPTPQVASAPSGAAPAQGVGGAAAGAAPGGAADGLQRSSRLDRVTGAVKGFVGGGGASNVGAAVKNVGGATLRGALGLAASPVAALGALGAGAATGYNTDTETYRKRFGLETDDPTFLGDLGVRALGVASDVGNAATFSGLRRAQEAIYGEGQWDGTKPAPTPAATPTAQPGQPSAPRYNFPNTAGGGRGSAADPNRTDVDPTNPAFGAARDMSRELGTVPRVMPGDLRKGVIHKTMDANGRPVYSGIDVGNDAQMVDGMGRQLRGGGTLSVMPGMSRSEIDATMARPMPGQGPGQGPVNLTAQGGLFDTPRARRQAEALRLEGRGQDLNFSATTRGQDMALKGTMATVGERREARMQELAVQQALRGRQAAYVQGAKGNLAQAAEAALANGDTTIAEALSAGADKGDARALKRREAVKDFLKPMSITKDKDGNPVVNDAMVETTTAALEGIAGQLGMASVDELLADANRARAAVKLLNGFNQRNQSFTDVIGLSEPTRRERLPNLRGSQGDTTGFFDGLLPGREMGDRRFVTKSGDLYLPQEIYADEGVQNLLADLMKQK